MDKNKLSNNLESEWYFFWKCHCIDDLDIHQKLPLKDVINKRDILWLWNSDIKEFVTDLKNSWWTCHFDLVLSYNGIPIHIYEINGGGHYNKNDFVKTLYANAAGIQLTFYACRPPKHSHGTWEGFYKSPLRGNIINICRAIGMPVGYFVETHQQDITKEDQRQNRLRCFWSTCADQSARLRNEFPSLFKQFISNADWETIKERTHEQIKSQTISCQQIPP